MIKILMIQRIILLCIFVTLVGCNNGNQDIWDRYHSINSKKNKKLSETHSRYFELNDNTDTNFVATPYGIHPKKNMASIF